jgi:hypothetical protein
MWSTDDKTKVCRARRLEFLERIYDAILSKKAFHYPLQEEEEEIRLLALQECDGKLKPEEEYLIFPEMTMISMMINI